MENSNLPPTVNNNNNTRQPMSPLQIGILAVLIFAGLMLFSYFQFRLEQTEQANRERPPVYIPLAQPCQIYNLLPNTNADQITVGMPVEQLNNYIYSFYCEISYDKQNKDGRWAVVIFKLTSGDYLKVKVLDNKVFETNKSKSSW